MNNINKNQVSCTDNIYKDQVHIIATVQPQFYQDETCANLDPNIILQSVAPDYWSKKSKCHLKHKTKIFHTLFPMAICSYSNMRQTD